jgi:Tol biopolymer transport system component
LIAGTLILVGLAGSAAAWLLWPARHWTVESNRPFISTLALESEPAFSPDGTVLAYTVGPDFLSRKIHVRNVAGGDGIKVADDAYDDRSPSWSSDGVHLAYVAIKPGEPCRIMVATIPAGGVRQAARCRRWDVSSVAWQPGTQFLYYSDAPPEAAALRNTGDIYRLDLDTGARRLVTRKEGMDSGGAVGNLHCSPDGKSLLYLWIHGLGVWEIMIHDLASGKEHSLGTIGGDPSAAWSADSRTVFASGATYIESTITAYPVDGAPGYRVYATGVHVRRIAVGGEGLLALETTINRDNLARASPTPAAQPDIIDPAGGITMSPTFAPDGTLAFVSNRSGNNAVWTMKPGAAPVQLYDGGASFLARLRYSPDGKKLALVVGSGTGVTIKILNADGASLSSFGMLRVGIGLPGWTPDSKDVLILERRDNRVYRINAENPAQRRPIAPPFWFGVTIRGDAIYGTRADGPGLWRIDKKPELISGKFPTYWQPGFAILGDEALIPDFSAPGGPRILAQPLAGGPDRVLAYAPGAATQANFQSAIAVNPKTGEIVYVAAVARDSNVDLLTLTKR